MTTASALDSANDTNTAQDIYVTTLTNVADGARSLLNTSAVGALSRVANTGVAFGDASLNGQYVGFSGQYGSSGQYAIGVRDVVGNNTATVTTGMNADVLGAVKMNDAATVLAFTTAATNVTASDDNQNIGADLFFSTATAGVWAAPTRVAVLDKGGNALSGANLRLWDVASTAQFALISTTAQLTSGDANQLDDLYRINLATGAADLVSRDGAGTAVGFDTAYSAQLYNNGADALWISPGYHLGGSGATYTNGYVPGGLSVGTNFAGNTANTLVSDVTVLNFYSSSSISEDGRYLSYAGNLNGSYQMFVKDLVTNNLVNLEAREGTVSNADYAFASPLNGTSIAMSRDGSAVSILTNRAYSTADSGSTSTDLYVKKLTLLDLLTDSGTGGALNPMLRDNRTVSGTTLNIKGNNLVAGSQVVLLEDNTPLNTSDSNFTAQSAAATVDSNGFANFAVTGLTAGDHTLVVADVYGNPYTNALFDNSLKVTVI